MKAFILETLIEYNEQINSLYNLTLLTRMPTKAVLNLSGKCKNTTLLECSWNQWASHQHNGAQCQQGLFQKGKITIIFGSSPFERYKYGILPIFYFYKNATLRLV